MIHTHQGLWEAVATGLARPLLAGKPTLVQPASAGYYGEAEELRRTRAAPILRRAILANTAFAAISAEIDREWRSSGWHRRRIIRMASGVDAEEFHPGASSVEADLLPRPRVMFTGRLHPQKNLPLLLEAWTEVARRGPANLILVGPGNDRQRLIELAASLGISDRVQFVGAVDNPADYLRAADIFVLPSVAEGMSNSLLEAMATALPCVVSGIGGNTDLIADGQTGRLVMEPTAEAWSRTLLELLENPRRRPPARQRPRAADRPGIRTRSRRRPLRRALPPDDRRDLALKVDPGFCLPLLGVKSEPDETNDEIRRVDLLFRSSKDSARGKRDLATTQRPDASSLTSASKPFPCTCSGSSVRSPSKSS